MTNTFTTTSACDLKAIEFREIIEQLSSYAISDQAKELANQLVPKESIEAIRESHREISEAVAILASGGTIPLNRQIGIRNAVDQMDRGYVLNPAALHETASFLWDMEKLSLSLKGKAEMAPGLAAYGSSIKALTDIREDIQSCVSHEIILDQASPDLARVRKRIGLVEAKIKDKLDKVIKNPAYKDCIQDQLISQRGGRYVIPIKTAYKRQIDGQVLDRSTSGSTVFIEPEEVKRLHDELNLLKCDEENICYRIQSELTNDLGAELKEIRFQLDVMTHCDWVFARAKLSRRHNCISPEMRTEPLIRLIEARHPLLEQGAIPLTIDLGIKQRGIVITGPNTGGKTVSMKTVGLLTHMALAGLHIPALKGSIIGGVSQILADIGDGQSISQNLSTFSSHMTNIARILERADSKTLVLLDEVGSGTDPKEGMGIAVAILEALYKKGCLILASTHFGEIKTFASEHPGFVNGSMGFDVMSLKPLYKLTVGKAGDSNGLLIAKRLGMPMEIIERASEVIGAERLEIFEEKGQGEIEVPEWIESLRESQSESMALSLCPVEREPDKLQKVEMMEAAEDEKIRPLAIGDNVKIPFMDTIGIVMALANGKGELEVMVHDKRIKIAEKRVKLYIAREDLYPSDYDFDVILKSKDYRKKSKLINKGKGKGLRIDY